MNITTKIKIMSYVSQPYKDICYYGDIVKYEGKKYWVNLAEEQVEFIGIIREEKDD